MADAPKAGALTKLRYIPFSGTLTCMNADTSDPEPAGTSRIAGMLSSVTTEEMTALLAVATQYVDAFGPEEMMTLPERMRLQEVEDILAKYGRWY